jgi:hypothetical protein
LLSFKFNLYRYTVVALAPLPYHVPPQRYAANGKGDYTRPLYKPQLSKLFYPLLPLKKPR